MIYNFEFLPGEYWWGGTTMHAYCPISSDSEYHQDFINDAHNQTMPFFVSSKGRYIWSEDPFTVDIKNGFITIDGSSVMLEQAGDNLRQAYLCAQSRHFPCDKKELESTFFTVPQYNSWIEFTYYPTQKKILKYAHDIIEHGFEPGIFIIDEGWSVHTGYGNWEFDFSRFPDPKAMVDELHSLGFTVMLWVVPFVTPTGPSFVRSTRPLIGTDPEMAKNIYKRNQNGDIAIVKWWNGVSAILDFTNSYDCRFLDVQLNHLMAEYGVDGFKFDGGNMDHYSSVNVINGEFDNKSSAAEMNAAWNEYGRKYKFHEYKDTFKGGGKNTIQRLHDRDHSWVYNGINEIIPCAINAGLTGHPFICPDMIGGGEWSNRYTPGFKVDEELFVRMAQCSALFPMMQFSWAPWEALNNENLSYCLDASKLHSEMSSKILEVVKESTVSGEPVIRCLEYNDPGNNYEEIKDEFMIGENILVAPVVTKGTVKRKAVFPKGMWKDEEGNVYEGRSEHILDAPISKLLWFERI